MNDNIEEPIEVIYHLKNSFKFAHKGDVVEAESITLLPPTMQQHASAAALKQSIYRMLTAMATDSDGQTDEVLAAKEQVDTEKENTDDRNKKQQDDIDSILNVIYTSKAINANAVWEQAKKLFINNVAMINGEQKMNMVLINKMSIGDFEQMTGIYIINFTTA